MKLENVKSLEDLILYGHISGLITIFLGMVVIAMDITNSDFRHIQVGIFICVVGYAFVKIAQKGETILLGERKIQGNSEDET
ncbi:MAG: hypothetical protein A2705_03590 [Omnitrophica WOR_2 bacterium RIFCSPHIGHO2_01_FULL_52_10]|nr:MAG: hypothetical protein A2705_03590 [Omnitrophica WOR_2 bacterium RIFCSPHIGHO2_01_FULL_52_10]